MFRKALKSLATLLVLFSLPANGTAAYSKVGAIDKNQKVLIPAIYRKIEYVGNGVYYCQKMHKVHPLKYSYDGILLDSNGNELPTNVPDGYTLSGAHIPVEGTIKNKLTETAILEIKGPDGFGLSNTNGEILLEPEYEFYPAYKGFYPVFEKSQYQFSRKKLLFIFDAVKGERHEVPENVVSIQYSPNKYRYFWKKQDKMPHLARGFMRFDGKVVVKPIYFRVSGYTELGVASAVKSAKGGKPEYFGENGKKLIFDRVNKDYIGEKPISKSIWVVQNKKDFRWSAISSSGKKLFTFPVSGAYVNGSKYGTYLCRILSNDINKARVVFLDSSGKILNDRFGLLRGSLKHGYVTIDRWKDKKLVDTKLVNYRGTEVFKNQKQLIEPLSEDRFLKVMKIAKFHPEIWKEPLPGSLGINRLDEFFRFLQDYDLIDMKTEKLEGLLGKPISVKSGIYIYGISHGTCGNFGTNLGIEVLDGKVAGWRFGWINTMKMPMTTYSRWIRNNVVKDPDVTLTSEDRKELRYLKAKY